MAMYKCKKFNTEFKSGYVTHPSKFCSINCYNESNRVLLTCKHCCSLFKVAKNIGLKKLYCNKKCFKENKKLLSKKPSELLEVYNLYKSK